MSVGYLAHSFDLINVRDLDLIAQAKEMCSRLVVGVFSDSYAEEIYGRRPVVPLFERMALVGHVRGVDNVVVDEGELPMTEGELTIFTVAGDSTEPHSAGSIVLTPRRVTASVILRDALQPLERDEVA